MINLRTLILLICALSLSGCSVLPSMDEVLPDKRKTYQKSRDLPNLEVPPDLTVTEGEYAAAIPSDEQSNTLSEFQRQRAAGTRKSIGGAVLGGGQSEGEQWLALQGSIVDIWPQLHQFWQENGYEIDLDDVELGVLETDWKEGEGDKHKFKIFTEPGESNDTILFLSSERQELSEGAWLEAVPDVTLEKKVIRKLSLHFYGTDFESSSSVADSSDTSSDSTSVEIEKIRQKAEVLDAGDGKSYLAIPQEFTRAWRDTEVVIKRAGYVVQESSVEQGTYNILYIKPEGSEDEEGFFNKLKFWGDDGAEGKPYQLSLTGVGNKTEIIVMNKEGEWETGEDARAILSTLQDLYNQL
jgi:outer membrane protein assembly factor BamC